MSCAVSRLPKHLLNDKYHSGALTWWGIPRFMLICGVIGDFHIILPILMECKIRALNSTEMKENRRTLSESDPCLQFTAGPKRTVLRFHSRKFFLNICLCWHTQASSFQNGTGECTKENSFHKPLQISRWDDDKTTKKIDLNGRKKEKKHVQKQ